MPLTPFTDSAPGLPGAPDPGPGAAVPATGPRTYELFPLMAGPVESAGGPDWHRHAERAAGLGFDWIALAPFQTPGRAGNVYAVADPCSLHPVLRPATGGSDVEALGRFCAALDAAGVRVMMDLLPHELAPDAAVVAARPDWFEPRASAAGDVACTRWEAPEARAGMTAWWRDVLRFHLDAGVRGFRCHAAQRVPAEVWAELIAGARERRADALFAALAPGAERRALRPLPEAGFDYLHNSFRWWDLRSRWLIEELDALRAMAASVSYPESLGSGRLARDLEAADAETLAAHYRLRLQLAAVLSAGLSVPMGYEYGFESSPDPVRGEPGDWTRGCNARRIDITDFVARVNRMKASHPAFNREGPQRLVAGLDGAVGLLRLAGEEGAEGCALTVFNPAAHGVVEVDTRALSAQVAATYDALDDVTPYARSAGSDGGLDQAPALRLAPLEVHTFRGEYRFAEDHAARYAAADARDAIDAMLGADHGDPFAVRGMHPDGWGGVEVRTVQPGAEAVEVVDARAGEVVGGLERVHEDGFFAGRLPGHSEPFPYRLRVRLGGEGGARVEEREDPYRFGPLLGETDVHLLREGTHRRAWEKLGAHPVAIDGVVGVRFAVWAPNARRVAVVGDFNAWDGRCHPMRARHECGVWEIFVPGLAEGERYKYEIKGAHGDLLPLKTDPVGFLAEPPPRTASVVARCDRHRWGDAGWLAARAASHDPRAPISIYEVHPGSWRRMAEQGNRYLSYAELAERLVPYARDMGFTHLELLPVSEYPFDGSWGYQPIGLFAPSSRFGTPAEFQHFVDCCHQAGLGVVLDWVAGHFPTDMHGLGLFDGTHLYEHADPRQGYHQDWNTLIYNYGRNEVANYLISNALYWLDAHHVDGLRLDAVASMLYLDYSREPGEWVPNRYGGNENLEAVAFIRRLNELVYEHHPDTFTVAEESTAWPAVSRPTWVGGLGFGFKWNMGWMHDTLRYMSLDPVHRRHHHDDLTFGLLYAFSENFVLPLSHDEVVHGKGSLLGRMPGDAWQRFANLRAYYGFMWAHPGKKLLFMGGELAQSAEWNHDRGLDWELLEDASHAGVQRLVRDLNALYRATPALHRCDAESRGFEWVRADDAAISVYAFLRRGEDGDAPVLVVCNFTPVPRPGLRFGVPEGGHWAERLNTDAEVYGGTNAGNLGGVAADPVACDGRPWSVEITLPPLATVLFEHEPE